MMNIATKGKMSLFVCLFCFFIIIFFSASSLESPCSKVAAYQQEEDVDKELMVPENHEGAIGVVENTYNPKHKKAPPNNISLPRIGEKHSAETTSNNPTPMQLVEAMSTPSFFAAVTDAQYEGRPAQKEIFTITIQGFPLEGDSFVLLSTGVAADAPGTADYFASTNMGGLHKPKHSPHGYDVFDLARLSVTVQVPDDASTLSFSYKFATEESPSYLGTNFRDYLIVQAWVPEASACPLIPLLPDSLYVVDINNAAAYSNLPSGSSIYPGPPLPDPNDTVYNAVTGLQEVEFDVSAFRGMEMILTIEIADASDEVYDSAVFLDGFGFSISDAPTDDVPSEPDDFKSWAEQAINWAEDRLEPVGMKEMKWYGWCARFVANAFMNTKAQSYNCPSVKPAGNNALPLAMSLDLYDQEPEGWSNAPRGALIFFDEGINMQGKVVNPHGHVAIYLGNNEVIHSYGRVKVNNLNQLTFGKGTGYLGDYIGWAYPPETWRPDYVTPPTLLISVGSPVSLRVYDYANRVTGVVNAEVKSEIPGSSYNSNTNEVKIVPALGNYRIETHGNDEGTYALVAKSYEEGRGITCLEFKDVKTASESIHTYQLEWDRIAEGKKGIAITIDGVTSNTSVPSVPSSPIPPSAASNIATDAILIWDGGDDVDGDKKIYYQVFFGTSLFPPVEETIGPFPAIQKQITYKPKGNPGELEYDTTYYWQIKAIDEFGITSEGPVWSFTTATAPSSPPGDDAKLSALTVSEGALIPAFAPTTTTYSVDVAHDVSSIDVTAILADANASLTVNGEPAVSGEPVTVALGAAGTATQIDFVVTAEDGETEKNYTATVKRALSPVPPPFFPQPEPEPEPDPGTGPEPQIKLGDVTGNGKIDVADVTLVMQHVLGLKTLTDDQKKSADVNGDGKIDVVDVVLMVQKVLGLINKFPAE